MVAERGLSPAFDPYHKWLGIPPSEQPPTYYRLLGVAVFESDPDVIEAAADKHATYLHSLSAGEQADAAEPLLNEISKARLCLLIPEKKAAYDEALRIELAHSAARAPAALAPPVPHTSTAQPEKKRPRSRRRRPSPRQHVVQIIIGGIAGLAISSLLLVYLKEPEQKPQIPRGEASSRARRLVETERSKQAARRPVNPRRVTPEIFPAREFLPKPAEEHPDSSDRLADGVRNTTATRNLGPVGDPREARPAQPPPATSTSPVSSPDIDRVAPVNIQESEFDIFVSPAQMQAGDAGYLVRSFDSVRGTYTPREARVLATAGSSQLVLQDSRDYYLLDEFDVRNVEIGSPVNLSEIAVAFLGRRSQPIRERERELYWIRPARSEGLPLQELADFRMGEKARWKKYAELWKDSEGKSLTAEFVNRTRKAVTLATFDDRANSMVETTYSLSQFDKESQTRIRSRPIDHPIRTWRAAAEDQTLEASFVDFRDNVVVLERMDGSIAEVASGALHDDDREWVREYCAYLNADPARDAFQRVQRQLIAERSQARAAARRKREQAARDRVMGQLRVEQSKASEAVQRATSFGTP